jgi:predicted nucleic acid-binding protein
VSLTDVEIAVAASTSQAALWTHDYDFDRIGRVLTDLDRYPT